MNNTIAGVSFVKVFDLERVKAFDLESAGCCRLIILTLSYSILYLENKMSKDVLKMSQINHR